VKARRCLVVIAIVTLIASGILSVVGRSKPREQALLGIEKLHQRDIAATLSGDPNKLAELWADDAVRLEPGPAEVGKKLITQHDAETMQKNGEMRILTYTAEIRDINIVDGWAFEWGYFSSTYRETRDAPVKSLRGKLLRVLERQHDGSWKFARVMWNLAEDK
jgi:ketosteroid isomerase-like protein